MQPDSSKLKSPLPQHRNRIIYSFAVLAVIILGLCSRKFAAGLPEWINTYLGDALWALMIYLIVAMLFKNKGIKIVAIISLLFCYTIELSQLYHAPWIDSIRSTTLGGLVLGFGFLWSDMIAYTIGIAMGSGIESMIFHSQKHKISGI